MYPKQVKNFISGDYSQKDEAFVERWVEEDPARKQELNELKIIWQKTGSLHLLEDNDIDDAWGAVCERMNSNKPVTSNEVRYINTGKRRSGARWDLILKVAAVLFLVFGFYAINRLDIASTQNEKVTRNLPAYHTIRSKNGERVQVQLQDGTVAILNSGSRLRYNDGYGKQNRTLYLSGEAYFKVNNENQSFPLIVETGQARVRDLSTEFNVKSYKGDKHTSVTVAKGSVEVAAIKDSSTIVDSVLVEEGRKVNVRDGSSLLSVERADLDYTLSWLDNKLIFKEATFKNMAEKLQRYYNIQVISKDKELNHKKVTATFKNEPLEKVLNIVALSLDAKYKIRGNRVVFSEGPPTVR